ncbi:hypothetical protein [Pleomorphochaeta sp. DL1XJH-081]|jgi:hypothetical protein|uniref:DUF7768 domain-containing protein n=1 Tax=Pleomorphochaeta sp. DL1XJH-081 TaxID=3409690 RepID=UPI003BB7024E
MEKKNQPLFDYHPMVYICSPYAGDIDENIRKAQRYSRFAVEKGYLPITPHLLFPQFLDDGLQSERDLGMFFGIVLMSKCAEVWVFGEEISLGMKGEIDIAERKGYKVKYFRSDCIEVDPKSS